MFPDVQSTQKYLYRNIMQITDTSLPDVKLITPKVFGDERGFFLESYNQKLFNEALNSPITFVQDNHSRSTKNVLRGLHYQIENPQGKLVRVTQGEVFDVAVDLRKHSKTFGQSIGVILSAGNKNILWVPPGFAHGFLVLSDTADFLYKTTDFYNPKAERCVIWNDPVLNIKWPVKDPILSAKDAQGKSFKEAEYFE